MGDYYFAKKIKTIPLELRLQITSNILRLPDCPEVERVFVMDYLHLYNPEHDMGCIKMFNVLDSYLEERSAPVVLSAAKLFYLFIKKLKTNSKKNILKDFMSKISSQITRFLKGHTNQEFQFSVMTFLIDLCDEGFIELLALENVFHFKPKDHSNCRKLKAQILFRFCELNVLQNGSEKWKDANNIVDYLLSQLIYQTCDVLDDLVSYCCQIANLCQATFETDIKLKR